MLLSYMLLIHSCSLRLCCASLFLVAPVPDCFLSGACSVGLAPEIWMAMQGSHYLDIDY